MLFLLGLPPGCPTSLSSIPPLLCNAHFSVPYSRCLCQLKSNSQFKNLKFHCCTTTSVSVGTKHEEMSCSLVFRNSTAPRGTCTISRPWSHLLYRGTALSAKTAEEQGIYGWVPVSFNTPFSVRACPQSCPTNSLCHSCVLGRWSWRCSSDPQLTMSAGSG